MNRKAFLLWVLTVGIAAFAVTMVWATAYAANHKQLDGMVTKIQSEVVYAKTPWGIRMIGTARQLGHIRPGDRVTIWPMRTTL